MKIVAPKGFKPKSTAKNTLTWEILNAKPEENIELAVSAKAT